MKIIQNLNLILFFSFCCIINSNAQETLTFIDTTGFKTIGAQTYFYEDKSDSLKIDDLLTMGKFKKCERPVPNFGINSSAIWLKFRIRNKSQKELLLKIDNPLIDEIELYYPEKGGNYRVEKSGEHLPYHDRPYDSENFIFKLSKDPEVQTYYVKIKGGDPRIVPLLLGTEDVQSKFSQNKNIIVGIFAGIMLSMLLYNLFIYFSIGDKTYLYYILGIFFVFIVQIEFMGYAYRYLWPTYPEFNEFCPVLFTSLAGFFVFNFARLLLNAKEYATNFNKVINIGIAAYGIAILAKIVGVNQIAFRILDLNAMIFPAYVFYVAIKRSRQNYRPAKFFVLAWTILLIGFSLYALKDLGILPFNFLTNYTMPLGTAIESILFSFALADRINILKKENEQKQNEIIKHLNENEKHLTAVKEAELIVERLKKETLASQLESLKNQVNPHFLFNSLNVLTELIQQNQYRAVKFVEELSDVYRYVLESRNKTIIHLGSELKFLDAFIYLLKIRFENKISININLDQQIHKKVVPPLALQLLIENAIKHNIISEESPLIIEVYSEDDYLIIKNKIQLKSGSMRPSGIGLKNIESRYRFLTDQKVIIKNENGFFIVCIPLLNMTPSSNLNSFQENN